MISNPRFFLQHYFFGVSVIDRSRGTWKTNQITPTYLENTINNPKESNTQFVWGQHHSHFFLCVRVLGQVSQLGNMLPYEFCRKEFLYLWECTIWLQLKRWKFSRSPQRCFDWFLHRMYMPSMIGLGDTREREKSDFYVSTSYLKLDKGALALLGNNNNSNNNIQRPAIWRGFELVGPTLLKDSLDAGWGLLPTL